MYQTILNINSHNNQKIWNQFVRNLKIMNIQQQINYERWIEWCRNDLYRYSITTIPTSIFIWISFLDFLLFDAEGCFTPDSCLLLFELTLDYWLQIYLVHFPITPGILGRKYTASSSNIPWPTAIILAPNSTLILTSFFCLNLRSLNWRRKQDFPTLNSR